MFLKPKHFLWHAYNIIIKFSTQRISFTYWPWMTTASWNRINEIINIPIKTEIWIQLLFLAGKTLPDCLAIDGCIHDDVIKWKHFPRYWPFVRGIHRSPVNSPHKGQWRGALMFTLICARINGWVNNREAGDFVCVCPSVRPSVRPSVNCTLSAR